LCCSRVMLSLKYVLETVSANKIQMANTLFFNYNSFDDLGKTRMHTE
jgi:hypothetical protein